MFRAADGLIMRKVLTVAGLRELIADVRAQGHTAGAVLVHPHHKRDLKQELMDAAPPLAGVETDDDVIGFVQGCMILSSAHVTFGTAKVLPKYP